MSSKGLSVTEYSRVLLSRYLQQAFDSQDRAKNLSIAAEELYVLLRKLRGAAGDRSDDLKAPLKAVRDAIETGPPSQAEALFLLLGRLEELLEDRAAQGLEREHAMGVQDILRYRLTRLVAGDAWDRKPHLKLRALKLMFGAMVRENEALMCQSSPGIGIGAAAGAGDGGTGAQPLPELRLGRSRSFGKGRSGGGGGGAGGASGAGQAAPRSKWQHAIQELGKAQGSKLLSLVKLLLAENLQLSTAAEAAAAEVEAAAAAAAGVQQPTLKQGQVAPSIAKAPVSTVRAPAAAPEPLSVAAAAAAHVPATPASPQAKAAPQQAAAAPPAFNMDDLLGLNDWQEGWTEEGQRTSPSPHSSLSDDPFAGLVEGRGPPPPPMYAAAPASYAMQPGQLPPVEGAGACLSSMSISVPARGPSQQYAYGLPPGFAPLAASTHSTHGYGGGNIPYLPQSPHNTGAAFTPYLPQSPPTFRAAPYQAGAPPQSSPHTPEALAPAPAARESPQYHQSGGGAGLGAGFYGGRNTPPVWGASEGSAAGVGSQMAVGPPSVGGSSSASGSAGGMQGRAGSIEAGGSERPGPPGLLETVFDTSSPYFGKNNPFGDGQFKDLSPLQAHRPPPPPPPTQRDSQKK